MRLQNDVGVKTGIGDHRSLMCGLKKHIKGPVLLEGAA